MCFPTLQSDLTLLGYMSNAPTRVTEIQQELIGKTKKVHHFSLSACLTLIVISRISALWIGCQQSPNPQHTSNIQPILPYTRLPKHVNLIIDDLPSIPVHHPQRKIRHSDPDGYMMNDISSRDFDSSKSIIMTRSFEIIQGLPSRALLFPEGSIKVIRKWFSPRSLHNTP